MLILKEHNHYYYQGHHQEYLRERFSWEGELQVPDSFQFRQDEDAVCFNVFSVIGNNGIQNIQLQTSYYIGLQYISKWKIPLLVEPKVNNDITKLHFLKMLTEALQEPENFEHLDGLMDVDFDADWIEVSPQHKIELTPFLLIQFLMAVKQIVKKGLKKSYYQKTENLRNRVKGKILVGQQVKQNIFKQRLTNTVCSYQEFGFDTPENKFIKYVLKIVYASIANFDDTFKTQLTQLLNYNLGAFHQVSDCSFKDYTKKGN